MKIFNRNGIYLFDTDKEEEIKFGTYGKIYKNDDDNNCFKVFNNAGYHKVDPIISIKSLSLPSFYKIIDLLYNDDFKYIGYIAQYYKHDNYNILSNREYLLNSFNNMMNDINILSHEGFLVRDLHKGNVIVNKDNITIIDADDYIINNGDNTVTNRIICKELMKSLLYNYVLKYNVSNHDKAYEMIKILLDEETDNINHFNNVMKKYKKPIDYFGKLIK